MESASSHSYVSKNFMDAYLKKKQKLQAKKEAPAKEMVAKGFKEDDQPLPTIVEEQSMLSSVSILKRRRSRSRSNSGSDEDVGRCRSMESICEGELGGRLNLSDSEGYDEPEMMMGA